MQSEPIIEIKDLSKKLKDIKAVDSLSLRVNKNDVYGFLGPNGSGKSTTIRMMLSLLYPDSGTIEILGKPLKSYRKEILRKVGAFIEKPDFYEYLSARKNLEIIARYSGFKISQHDIAANLELVGLQHRASSKVQTFSKGMKQRLGIAQTLLHDPEILILDEPASGLDPSGNRDVRKLIMYLNKEKNKTIILSSHNLAEIEMIANRMIIIKEGKKMVEGSVAKLLTEHTYVTHFKVNDPETAIKYLKSSPFKINTILKSEQGLQLHCKRNSIPEINAFFVEKGIRVESIRIEQNLEDYFLNLT